MTLSNRSDDPTSYLQDAQTESSLGIHQSQLNYANKRHQFDWDPGLMPPFMLVYSM